MTRQNGVMGILKEHLPQYRWDNALTPSRLFREVTQQASMDLKMFNTSLLLLNLFPGVPAKSVLLIMLFKG